MELAEQTVSSALVYSGRFLKVYRDEARLPDGAAAVREVVRHPGAVVVVPVDEAGNVPLVRRMSTIFFSSSTTRMLRAIYDSLQCISILYCHYIEVVGRFLNFL